MLTIFRSWAEPQMAAYRQPSRRGTPKGHKIGLSWSKKYSALIQSLHGPMSIPELCDALENMAEFRISPALMKLWRTEGQFRDVANQATREFADCLLQEVQRCLEEDNHIKGLFLLEVLVNLPVFKIIRDRLVEVICNSPEYLTCLIEVTERGAK